MDHGAEVIPYALGASSALHNLPRALRHVHLGARGIVERHTKERPRLIESLVHDPLIDIERPLDRAHGGVGKRRRNGRGFVGIPERRRRAIVRPERGERRVAPMQQIHGAAASGDEAQPLQCRCPAERGDGGRRADAQFAEGDIRAARDTLRHGQGWKRHVDQDHAAREPGRHKQAEGYAQPAVQEHQGVRQMYSHIS